MRTGVVSGESTCVAIMGCWATCIEVYVRPVTWNVRRRPTSRARARAAMTALLPPRTSAAPHVSMRRTSAALDVSVAASAASSPKKQAARAFIMAVLLLSTRALQRMCESTLIPRMVTVESLRGRARLAEDGAARRGSPCRRRAFSASSSATRRGPARGGQWPAAGRVVLAADRRGPARWILGARDESTLSPREDVAPEPGRRARRP